MVGVPFTALIGFWFAAHLNKAPDAVALDRCASCAATPTEHVPLTALPSIKVPYCADCAERARRRAWRGPLILIAIYGLVPFVAVAAPIFTLDGMLEGLFFFALAVAVIFSLVATLHLSAPRGATARHEAVRVDKLLPSLEIHCTRKDVAEAFVAASGGYLAPRRQVRVTPLLAAPLLALATAAFGLAGALALFTSNVHVDNGGTEPVVVVADGVTAATVPAGEHREIGLRRGRHHLEWRSGHEHNDASVFIDPQHEILLNPGPTVCYWKQVGVYKPEYGSKTLTSDEVEQARKAGPLPVAELYFLPKVKGWFERLPERKSEEPLDSNIDVAILREPRCTKLLQKQCAAGVVTEFLRCEAEATTQERFDECARQAAPFCGQ